MPHSRANAASRQITPAAFVAQILFVRGCAAYLVFRRSCGMQRWPAGRMSCVRISLRLSMQTQASLSPSLSTGGPVISGAGSPGRRQTEKTRYETQLGAVNSSTCSFSGCRATCLAVNTALDWTKRQINKSITRACYQTDSALQHYCVRHSWMVNYVFPASYVVRAVYRCLPRQGLNILLCPRERAVHVSRRVVMC